jgi:hypothetical protein
MTNINAESFLAVHMVVLSGYPEALPKALGEDAVCAAG